MTLREFLNGILSVIGAASLTDDEFDLIPEGPIVGLFDIAMYEALLGVLNTRDMIDGNQDRLRFYFLARGVQVGELKTARSNIFVGGSLED